jgi:hypothetical protein
MKLIFCTECHDIIRLTKVSHTCTCGKSRGIYLDDVQAEYYGPAVPLGIDNTSFINAVMNQPDRGMGKLFTGFVIPVECKTFKKGK